MLRSRGEWSDHLPSQFLSKQSMTLIKKQLGLATADKQAEFDEICSLTNPTVKKALLKSFADDCDSAAVHLQAAALPRQKYQVILPITSMKDNEVYAPNYRNGEQVALIRFPHGGTFEIPVLTVNNKQADAKIKEFDADVDAKTAQTLNELQAKLKEDMAVELARLKEETKNLVANLEADYDQNHKKLADNILKQLIEG